MNSLECLKKARWKPGRVSSRETDFSWDSRESRELNRPSALEQNDQGFGLERAWKTRQERKGKERNGALSLEPSHPFYRGWEPPRYAGRTRVRGAYAYVMHDRVLDCLGLRIGKGVASHRSGRGRSEA